eukprot:407182_1
MAEEKKQEPVKLDDFESNSNNIVNRIWLGSEDAAHTSLDILDKHNIKFILVAGFGITALHENNDKSSIKYKKLKCIDLSIYDITKDIIVAIKFIETSLNNNEDGNLLIHCARGKSRSASICIAYLMWKQNISFEDAKYMVKKKRKIISINAGFEKQLKEFDKTKANLKL